MVKAWMMAAAALVSVAALGAVSCKLSYETVPEHVTLTLTANGLQDAA